MLNAFIASVNLRNTLIQSIKGEVLVIGWRGFIRRVIESCLVKLGSKNFIYIFDDSVKLFNVSNFKSFKSRARFVLCWLNKIILFVKEGLKVDWLKIFRNNFLRPFCICFCIFPLWQDKVLIVRLWESNIADFILIQSKQ